MSAQASSYMQADASKAITNSPPAAIPPRLRSPTAFGPAPGPRQSLTQPSFIPAPFPRSAWQTSSSSIVTGVTYTCSSPTAITRLLPDGFALSPLVTSGQRRPTVLFERMDLRGLPWLAGRGYNTWGVFLDDVICTRANTRPRSDSFTAAPADDDPLDFRAEEAGVLTRVGPSASATGASFLLVLFESACDPIVTGREELGFPKVWAEMPDVEEPQPGVEEEQGETVWKASWHGHEFLRLAAPNALFSNTSSAAARQLAPKESRQWTHPAVDGLLSHRYIPSVGLPGAHDASYAVYMPGAAGVTTPPADPANDSPPPITTTTTTTATRSASSSVSLLPKLTIHPASFQQLPTLQTIVDQLAALQSSLDTEPVEWYHRVVAGGAGDCARARRIEW